MKVAVISDIHANRHAFEAALEAVAASDASEVWCLGDLVGYGAEPDACVELAREHAAVCLVRQPRPRRHRRARARRILARRRLAAQWTKEVIAPENLDFLKSLRPQGEESAIGLYHASPRDPVWEYVLSALLAELCMDEQATRIGLIGHSHVALSFVRHERSRDRRTHAKPASSWTSPSGEWLLNPGSVGQPRDGDPRAAWLLLDLDGMTASFQRTDYDIAGAAAAIRAARLPDSLAERLEYGQ